MPEGPECRVTVDFLRNAIVGSHLNKIEILSGRYTRHGPPSGLSTLMQLKKVGGFKLIDVKSHGKFIYFEFEDEVYCFCTLGMTGNWSSHKSEHTRLSMHFGEKIIYFADPRNFGTIKFLIGKEYLLTKLKSLGWDPLQSAQPELRFILHDKRCVCEILMDQSIFAGVGNYLKAEILYASRISPHRKGTELAARELDSIIANTIRIVHSAYASGGTTVRDFAVDGGVGNYQKDLKVYGKERCPEGYLVFKTLTSDKRTTHWVPALQK